MFKMGLAKYKCFLVIGVAGGAGGKGTWGNPLIPYTEFGKADPADPNYDSEEVCRHPSLS